MRNSGKQNMVKSLKYQMEMQYLNKYIFNVGAMIMFSILCIIRVTVILFQCHKTCMNLLMEILQRQCGFTVQQCFLRHE